MTHLPIFAGNLSSLRRCAVCKKVTHKSARGAILAIKAQPDKNLAPYHCKECGKWHLTTNRRGNYFFQGFIDRVLETDKEKATRLNASPFL